VRTEYLAERADKKVIIFDMLVDMAEKEYDIQIRKNYTPELSKTTKNNTNKKIVSTCDLLEQNRQVYYRALKSRTYK
jgi:hypothetical protein